MAAAMLWDCAVTCAPAELSVSNPPSGMTCGAYLEPYLAPGRLQTPSTTSNCSCCALSSADQYLIPSVIGCSDRWANFGYLFGSTSCSTSLLPSHYIGSSEQERCQEISSDGYHINSRLLSITGSIKILSLHLVVMLYVLQLFHAELDGDALT